MAFLNLCSDCIENNDTSQMEYCGLTMSLAPECDWCGKNRGKFGYYKESAEDNGYCADPEDIGNILTDTKKPTRVRIVETGSLKELGIEE